MSNIDVVDILIKIITVLLGGGSAASIIAAIVSLKNNRVESKKIKAEAELIEADAADRLSKRYEALADRIQKELESSKKECQDQILALSVEIKNRETFSKILEGKVFSLQAMLDEVKEERDFLHNQVMSLRGESMILRNENVALRERIERMSKDIDSLKANNATLNQ